MVGQPPTAFLLGGVEIREIVGDILTFFGGEILGNILKLGLGCFFL